MYPYLLVTCAVAVSAILVAAKLYIENVDLSNQLIELKHRSSICAGIVEARREPEPTQIMPNRIALRRVWN